MALNWYVGWSLLLAGFVSGALVGMFFHREQFLGGYGSFRRRLVRLGHIACAALGMLNLIYSLAPAGSGLAASLLVTGGIAMPLICFLAAWRPSCRHLFFLPVIALTAAVILTLCGRGEPLARPMGSLKTGDSASRPYDGGRP